jgi:SAM-dependent methyltransferase/ribosomal protein S27E
MKESEIRNREVFKKYLELSAKDAEVYFADRSLFSNINCPACQSSEVTFFLKKNDFTYSECLKCSTFFVNPRPSLEQYDKFYSDSPSTSYWVNNFFKPVMEARREKIFKPRAEYISNFLINDKNLVIGDVGAGFGLFLEELGKIRSDFQLIAIEPSKEMAQICTDKGIEVIPTLIEDVTGYDEKFDVLLAFELFEHLHNPEGFLRKIHQLLKPGGILFFTTLNGLGFDIGVLGEKSNSIAPPHHINFFNPQSAGLLLEVNGFEVIEASTPGKLDWDIVETSITSDDFIPERIWKIISKYASPESKKKLQNWISESNMSSHMRIVGRKK